jgi:hypothetical protein
MKNKVWIAIGLALFIITSNLAATAGFIGPGIAGVSINAPNAQPWGRWSQIVFCPAGSYVNGYSMRVEPPQADGRDDTALNAIRLFCYSPNGINVGYAGVIEPHPGIWGDWGPVASCPQREYAKAFSLKVESFQGSGDDTGANSLKFLCTDRSEIEASNGGRWGNWSHWLHIGELYWLPSPQNKIICGVRARFENHIGARDDTALNDLEFFWCSL